MILPFLIFAGSFLFYLITLNGTIPAYRDSGDLINAVYTLGIAHPPGYPLYTLIGHVFLRLVPFANVAYRLNLFSACAAAAAAAGVHVLARRGGGRVWSAAGTAAVVAILYAVTPAVQNLARVSEMYTLAAFFAAGIIFCSQMSSASGPLLASFLLGCGFGVHPTLLFLSPLLVTFIPKEALRRVGFFLLGFSVVFILLVRSQAGPVQNWGDPSTLKNLWTLITRSNYGGLKLHPEESQFAWTLTGSAQQGIYFLRLLIGQWGWLCLGIGLIGLIYSWKENPRLLLIWILAGPGFVLLSNLPIGENTTTPILEPYFLLTSLIWALWVARGMTVVLDHVPSKSAQVLMLLGLLILPMTELRGSFQNFRDDFFAYDLGRNMLRTLPPRAAFYDPDDTVAFTLRSLQLTEDRRTDVALLSFFRTQWGYEQIARRWPDLLPPVPVRDAQTLIYLFWNYSMKQRPFYVDLPTKVSAPQSYDSEGLLYRATSAPTTPALAQLKASEQLFDFYVWRGDWRTLDHEDFFTQHIFNYRSAARCNLGLKYVERQDLAAARQHYLEALAIDPHLAAAYNNLGVVDFNQHQYQRAIRNYQLALRYDPANVGYQHNLQLSQASLAQDHR